MNIRKIKPSDNLALATMIREVFIEHNAPRHGTVYSDPTTDDLYALFERERSVLWVAEEKEQIYGCCGIYPTDGLEPGMAELVKFYLSAPARGKGIGRKLLEQSISSAAAFGYKSIYLESLPHFSKAIAMYEKQGFSKLSQPMGDSEHPTCDIWMIKKL